MKATAGERIAAPRRGTALVLALVLMMTVLALGAAFLRVTTAVTSRQTSELETMRAFYLAEAGLAEAFQAVRVGRTGQVGSEAAPAVYGDGLLWVDATDTADDQVRLECTALCGTGRATLSLVVEPVEISLGFFSDEDLVVESVLLVDGFDSGERTYEAEVNAQVDIQEYAGGLARIVGREVVIKYVSDGSPQVAHELAYLANFDAAQEAELVALFPALHEALAAGTLFGIEESTPTSDLAFSNMPGSGTTDSGTTESNAPAGGGDASTPTIPDRHTISGGLLGTNGNVQFTMPNREPVEIYGDVTPGPYGEVQGLDVVQITGSTEPRMAPVDLPAVEIPAVDLAAPVSHDGLLPMLVPPGATGYERIQMASDAELVLRGPATVVIGTLVLEPGALLTLDTRDGDVALYVTGGMDLQPGSVVTTSSDLPEQLSIQVASIPTDLDGAPVKLEATSQFYGTIYAPETEVHVGGEFEVYGGIVARKLNLGPGAKLHYDTAEYDASPIPRLVSWRIVEIPRAVRVRRGDPYVALGVERGTVAALSEAHDLAGVVLTIDYLDRNGGQASYVGGEDAFDWSGVTEVLKVDRVATRPKEDPETTDPETEEPAPVPGRQPVVDLIDGFPMLMNSKDLVDGLIPLSPLSAEEWAALEAKLSSGGQYNRLLEYQ